MRPALGRFVCASGHAFEEPLLSDVSCGEFLLRSANGEVAYLNAFEDAAFDEVHRIVADLAPALNDQQRADVFHRVLVRSPAILTRSARRSCWAYCRYARCAAERPPHGT